MRSHPRQSLLSLPVLILALGSAMTLVACNSAEPTAVAAAPVAERLVDVPAIKVGVADLESTLQVSGNLAPQTRVAIMAKLPGTLSRMSVQVGDRVRQGQTVATLDRREIDAQVDAATAAVSVTHAALEGARLELASASTELGAAVEIVSTQVKAVEMAREGLSIAEVSYENGAITSTELNDAHLSLLETEWELMQAKYGQIVAAARTRYAAGL